MNTLMQYFYLALANIELVGILALVFLAVAAVVAGVYSQVGRQNIVQQRLGRLLPGRPPATEVNNGLIGGEQVGPFVKLTRSLQDVVVAKKGSTRKELRLRLIRAGFRSESALYNYMGAKVLLAILLPVLYAVTRFFYNFTPEVIVICCALLVIGYFLPNLVLMLITRARQKRMRKALPDALDLMVVCVESGLGLDMTFKRVGEEIRSLSSDLSDEFFLTNLETRAGRSRDESFKEMALRTGLPEIHSLMTMFIQTSRFGTSLAKALRIHADAMRVKRRQIAEEKAAKCAVKLVFPLVMFIFPSLLIVLAGPAAIRIMQALFPALSK